MIFPGEEDAKRMAEPHTLTFLFTDVEGSTYLWEKNPKAMSEALAQHDEILRTAIEAHDGHVFKTVGDAFHAAFPTAPKALSAALDAQRALHRAEWEETGPLRVRMALHTGAAEERAGDYFGPSLNRVARLLSAGHGSQVLLSLTTEELVRDELPEGVGLRDLGERRLKDLFRPEHIFQITASGLPTEFAPLRTLDARLNNLPAQPTPLVGREREVAQVCEQLRNPAVRLLTLTGPGGTGKTRLGLQAAAELMDEFEGGTFFVPLAPVTDPTLVAPTIVRALGLTETGDQMLEELLRDYLRDRHTLLLLDNFEQVLGAAPLVTELLSAAPGLKVLTTSRTLLRLYGEYEFAVPPLEVPDPKRPQSLEQVTQYEAVRLFIERARAAKADFTVTSDNAPEVAEICARLDGLPLAIELAAARIKLLSPKAMLDRLGDRLRLLTGGARNLPERQRTLRGAIEWSYELLDAGEKTLFTRVAVFSGGFTLEAMETICDAEGELPLDIIEGASSLLDKSLLRQEEGAEDEPRFVMLETIHEYARERLEQSGETGEIRKLHAQYFLALAEQGESKLRGPEEARWLEHLEIEHDNMREALSWALDGEEAELGLRLAGALWRFWWIRGHYHEGRRWLEEALAKDSRVSAARAKALEAVGWLADDQGDIDRAVAAAEEGLDLSAEAGIQSSVAAPFLRILGSAAVIRGDHERAARLYEESLALSREAEDTRSVASSLLQLGNVTSERGDYEGAKGFYEEGLALSRKLDDTALLTSYLISLGYESLLQGDPERGATLNEEAAVLLGERGHKGKLQYALDNLGWAALMRGDHQQARSLHQESLVLSRELGDKLVAAESLEGLACSAARGEEERAARLFGATEALREAVGYHQAPRERALREPFLGAARSRLEEAKWEAAWAEGRAMTFEDAVAYALEDAGK
jgi:predicted ATPase/class 3 adenylate cyclase